MGPHLDRLGCTCGEALSFQISQIIPLSYSYSSTPLYIIVPLHKNEVLCQAHGSTLKVPLFVGVDSLQRKRTTWILSIHKTHKGGIDHHYDEPSTPSQ